VETVTMRITFAGLYSSYPCDFGILAEPDSNWQPAELTPSTPTVFAGKTFFIHAFGQEQIVEAMVRTFTDGRRSRQPSGRSTISHLDLLLPKAWIKESLSAKTVGVDGVSSPGCQYCPVPQVFRSHPGRTNTDAKVILMVTVSTKGRGNQVDLVKDPGFGLGESAIEDVSGGEFRPGMQNEPSTVAVPIEVNLVCRGR